MAQAEDDFPIEASQIVDHFNTRDRQLAERDEQLAAARAEFRQERDAERTTIAAERAEIERLKKETQTLHREATRERDRTKRLAIRYARRVRQKWSAVRTELETQKHAIDEARGKFSAETVRFNTLRSEFHTTAAEEKERQREAWVELEAHRKRLAAERTEMNEFQVKQEAALADRAAEIALREKGVSSIKAKLESETATLRQEAAGLEARAVHARSVVEELEKKRDDLRAELLASAPKEQTVQPGEFDIPLDRRADRDLARWTADLDAQDRQLVQEKANLAKVKASLDREATSLADQRKVLAEQFAMLAAARSEWQEVESRTIAELEELARAVRQRDEEQATREERIVKADARRREESHDLWRLRLRLEAWQSKLTAVSRLWHGERERREQDLAARAEGIAIREATLQQMFERWEHSREDERERLRVELQLWADDRTRMVSAAEELDRRTREVLAELTRHAARAMASEDLLAETVGKGKGTTRRFQVLSKRWERVFDKKIVAIEARRMEAKADFARLDERFEDLHRGLKELAERESDLNQRTARTQMRMLGEPTTLAIRMGPSATELATLRDEFERMAHVLIEAGVPESPDEQLPWAEEEEEPEYGPDVLPFALRARAA